MSAYKDNLHISAHESGARAELAAELLSEGRGVVVLNQILALRPTANGILCEVIGRKMHDSSAYEAMVAEAQSLLEGSFLFPSMTGKKLSWLVVEDYGTGTLELWHAT